MGEVQIDYRDLLKRYLAHVGECEGVTFLGDRWLQISSASDISFTPQEIAELRNLNGPYRPVGP